MWQQSHRFIEEVPDCVEGIGKGFLFCVKYIINSRVRVWTSARSLPYKTLFGIPSLGGGGGASTHP